VVLSCAPHLKSLRERRRIVEGTFDGTRAITLVATVDLTTKPRHIRSRTRVAVDARTFVPLGVDSTNDEPGGFRSVHGSYRHEFVRPDSLPSDFFTTASVDAWVATH
jgi:hypothetical protein